MDHPRPGLRWFSKLTCFSTLILIFAGSLVTSTGSGLAVPDWPLSYGTWFPPMVGGIFYEHGHRMIASLVGFFMLVLTVWLGFKEKRKWVRRLGIAGFGAVVLQGILGGMTVLFLLPTPISVAHGILAQTFFIITIIIAYSESSERKSREREVLLYSVSVIRWGFVFTASVYLQLILGALMRHTGSGLAIPDFPRMGGYFFPTFDAQMLKNINEWRFFANLDAVSMPQVVIHFLHRIWAIVVLVLLCILNWKVFRSPETRTPSKYTILLIDALFWVQILLGIMTVLSQKQPFITSFHVVNGAAILGMGILFLLRAVPL